MKNIPTSEPLNCNNVDVIVIAIPTNIEIILILYWTIGILMSHFYLFLVSRGTTITWNIAGELHDVTFSMHSVIQCTNYRLTTFFPLQSSTKTVHTFKNLPFLQLHKQSHHRHQQTYYILYIFMHVLLCVHATSSHKKHVAMQEKLFNR